MLDGRDFAALNGCLPCSLMAHFFFGRRQHMETGVRLRHYRMRTMNFIFRKGPTVRVRNLLTLAFTIFLPCQTLAQVTHGQKPKLPAPFASKSAGNGPERAKPPAGFLPTVPEGFRENVFATNFRHPRWRTAAPKGSIFVAGHEAAVT